MRHSKPQEPGSNSGKSLNSEPNGLPGTQLNEHASSDSARPATDGAAVGAGLTPASGSAGSLHLSQPIKVVTEAEINGWEQAPNQARHQALSSGQDRTQGPGQRSGPAKLADVALAASAEPQERRGPTAWHPLLYEYVRKHAPSSIEIRTEFELSQRPRRADMVFIRRDRKPSLAFNQDLSATTVASAQTAPAQAGPAAPATPVHAAAADATHDDDAQVFRGLWRHLGEVSLVEFKSSVGRYRLGDLFDLFSYATQYLKQYRSQFTSPKALSMVLIIPGSTGSLTRDIDFIAGSLEPLQPGYARITGPWYTIYIVFIDEVCEAERDDYLRAFSSKRQMSREVVRWFNAFFRNPTMENLRDMEDFDDVIATFLDAIPAEDVVRHYKPEELLARMAPEERLAGVSAEEIPQALRGLAPEERLAGMAPEERLAGVPAEEIPQALRALTPEERLAGMSPEEIKQALRALPPEVLAKLNGHDPGNGDNGSP